MQEDKGFGDIVNLVKDLRVRCDFDRALTLDTLRPYLREELAEFEEAQDGGNEDRIAAELGDILLHCAFQLVLAEERAAFDLEQVSSRLVAKMKARHPHLYAGGEKPDWEKMKVRERASVLGRLPGGLPELETAYRYQERAAAIGFDWPDVRGPLDKLEEEVRETREHPTEEIGDVLFAAVNVARKAGIHPTIALRQATQKFISRFEAMERMAAERGLAMSSLGLERLDELWNEAKALRLTDTTGTSSSETRSSP